MPFLGCFASRADMLDLVKQQQAGTRHADVLDGRNS